MAPHKRMLVALVMGFGLGALARAMLPVQVLDIAVDHVAQPIGQIFLRLLFVLVVPLLFSALVVGIAELDLTQLGRLGRRTLGYTLVVSLISVVIGMVLVNIVGPGRGVSPDVLANAKSPLGANAAKASGDLSATSLIVAMVPKNAIAAAAEGDMLALIVFALLFGIALANTKSDNTDNLRAMIAGLYEVCITWIDAVLRIAAPVGVFALLFTMASRIGASLLLNVGSYALVVVFGLALHNFGVYAVFVARGEPETTGAPVPAT